MRPRLFLGFCGLIAGLLPLPAETPRPAAEIYAQNCASCHGARLEGGSAPSMLDEIWRWGGDRETLARIIRQGSEEAGMPAFAGGLTEAEVQGLVAFIAEQRSPARTVPVPALRATQVSSTMRSEKHAFRVETVIEGLEDPWSLAWLPDGRMLITEKAGRLRQVVAGTLQRRPIEGTPSVRAEGQGGLLEVAPHPDFARNGWIYLAFSHGAKNPKGEDVAMTKLVRGRIRDGRWVDEESVWAAPLSTYVGGGRHFGCRIAFDTQGYLYFTIGDRGPRDHAQQLRRPNGKVHRIHDDGRIPADNPFVSDPEAIPSIWTFGNRNPQGLDFDPATGDLWSTEHGPRGGDELNLIERGRNYGWPLITYGTNYNRTKITDETSRPGLEQPVVQWTPSIAVCGIDFYQGEVFPAWSGNLFVTALAHEELRRLVFEKGRVVQQEVLLKKMGRLRDVASGPDGHVYVVANRPGKILRLVPE